MSLLSKTSLIPSSLTRAVAIASLMGATMLSTPLIAAHANNVGNAPFQLAQAAAPQDPASTKAEMKAQTVEQRIDALHTSLKITTDEEADWKSVAQAMRDNAASMQRLVADRNAQGVLGMTAVDDLNAYQTFAQAHLDGLKNLTSSFAVLYKSMPDAQKKVADQVFQGARRGDAPSRG